MFVSCQEIWIQGIEQGTGIEIMKKMRLLCFILYKYLDLTVLSHFT